LGGVVAVQNIRIGLDPWPARLMFLLALLLIPGSQILLYPILWILMPLQRPKSPSARHARPKRPMQTATRFAWPVPPQIGMRDQWRECVNSVEAQRNRSRRLQLPVSVWRQPGSVDETETDPSSGSADQAWSQRGGADRRASECGDLQGARDQGSRPALARAGHAGARFSLSCPDRTSSGPVQP